METIFFSTAEPCPEVSSSWNGRLSQCCGVLAADFVFIAKLVQVSNSICQCGLLIFFGRGVGGVGGER